YIVSRCAKEESIAKLKKAGADKVTMPEQLSGYHMASMALRPNVVDFLDIIVDGKHDELQIDELEIQSDSEFVNQPISSYLYQKNNNINVLAICRSDGTTRINPQGDEIIGINDKLILMGGRQDLEKIIPRI
ncbi:MAG: TrkA C-terminal domain-containing protein, partial [Bacteriovoracaceae bacterium]